MKKLLSFLFLSFCSSITPIIVKAQTVSSFISSGLNKPAGVATDAAGNIYVADENGNRVVKYTPTGVQTVLASPVGGYMLPNGVAVDASNNVYVSTNHFNQHTVFKVTPTNVVSELVPGTMDGPVGVAVDGNYNLYVADLNANTVRKITQAGVSSVFTTQVDFPVAVAVDGNGNVYVLSGQDSKVYKFTSAGTISTSFDGLSYPSGIAVDANNNVFVADTYGHRIVKITSAGILSHYAGSEGIAGNTNGTLEDALFTEPFGIAVDANNQIYISEFSPNTIRKITPATLPVTLASYTAQINGNYALLEWKTESEQNNKSFVIYRSGDDKVFAELTRIAGAGNSATVKKYSYVDRMLLNGNNYYKLVQIDGDGKTKELGVKIVTFDLNTTIADAYPNPTLGKVKLSFDKGIYNTIVVSNSAGKVLRTYGLKSDVIEAFVDLSDYPKGIYFFRLAGLSESITRKVVKQ